jgi:electron transfer flavoprotein beta subunit
MIYVIKVDGIEDGAITVRRELEDGYEVVKAKLPAAITVLKAINTLRMPSLKGKMKAKSATILQITVADLDPDPERLGLKGSPTWVSKIFTPPVKGNRQTIQDDQGSAGKSIFDILKNLGVV